MSMLGHRNTSPSCSTPTPTDSNDSDLDTHTAKRPMFPRFLVVESTDPQKKLWYLNDDIMDLTIGGVTSASVSIKWMGPSLLVDVSHEAYAHNLQQITQIDQFPVKVSPHRSLNTRKGVAKLGRAATGMSNEEVRNSLNSSPRNRDMPFVAEAYRVSVNGNSGKQQTGTFFLTTLPKKIWLGFEQFDVHHYVPSQCRCFKCQKFGHNFKTCRAREEVCQTCTTPGHSKDTCPNSDNPKCLNCKGSHTASSRDCARFVTERAALQIHAESNCSLVDARQQVEQTSATTNIEPDHASAPEQQVSYARSVAINQAELINRNPPLSEENARLREVINKLSQDNASLQQRLDGFGKRLSNLEKSRVGHAHHGTPRDGAQTITPTPVGSTHSPSTVGYISALPPDTTDGVHNTTSVGSAHNANPVGDTHSHPVSKANRASQTEMQRGSNSLAKPSADATARSSGVKSPQKSKFQQKKLFKERVEITPSYIPNQSPIPRTKVLLDRLGPVGTRQGVVSFATKPAGDRPQRLSSMKWWRPLSFSGVLEGSGQTEETLTSWLVNSSQKWFAFRKLNWSSHPNLKHSNVPTMTATTEP